MDVNARSAFRSSRRLPRAAVAPRQAVFGLVPALRVAPDVEERAPAGGRDEQQVERQGEDLDGEVEAAHASQRPDDRPHRRDGAPAPGPTGTPPQGTPTAGWDVDGMPPRHHTSGPGAAQAGWTDPPRAAPPGGGPTDAAPGRPPGWEDSGPGVSR